MDWRLRVTVGYSVGGVVGAMVDGLALEGVAVGCSVKARSSKEKPTALHSELCFVWLKVGTELGTALGDCEGCSVGA